MRGRRLIACCCVLAGSLLSAAPAGAAANEDFAAVYSDWSSTGSIPNCRYSKAQLINAREQSKTVEDFATYAPTFTGEVNRALAHIDKGGCRGVARPPSKRKLAKSAIRAVRIGRIRPRGRESVVVTNRGKRTVSLAGASLRDRRGHRVRLRGSLRPGASRRVHSRGVWDDGGDVVKLTDRKGLVVRQRGFGRWARVVRF
jgi:hypothetical protein